MKLTLLKIVLPLLIVHGWPGSVVEFLDIIPLLVQGNEKVTKYIVIIIIAWLSSNFKLGSTTLCCLSVRLSIRDR